MKLCANLTTTTTTAVDTPQIEVEGTQTADDVVEGTIIGEEKAMIAANEKEDRIEVVVSGPRNSGRCALRKFTKISWPTWIRPSKKTYKTELSPVMPLRSRSLTHITLPKLQDSMIILDQGL